MSQTGARERNWAGNYGYSAARIERPESIDQLQAIVRANTNVRALGTRHSFNAIADSTDTIVALSKLNRIVGLDRARRTVTIEGGVRYGELGAYLHNEGFALHNLASLPHISVAGACATATHSSGERNGTLATAVSAMDIVVAAGDIVAVSRESHGAEFDGMVVALGALGVVARLTLDVEPTFEVRQDVYENLTLEHASRHFDEIQASGYSVSLFTDWTGNRFTQVWLKRRIADVDPAPLQFFGASPAAADRHPIAGISAESCNPQMGVAGPWYERLPHFRMDFTPSSGEELQSEYYVPRDHATSALGALMRIGEQIAPHLLVTEVRTIAADTLWLSPCCGRDCVAIHFTWKPTWPAVRELLATIEAVLEPFDARPHWGKLFVMPPRRIAALFERMPDFQRLLMKYDPAGTFRNAFVESTVFARE